MDWIFLVAGASLGGLAVVLGAFASHALRGRLSPNMLRAFETGVLYHFLHALALCVVALLMAARRLPAGPLQVSGWLFVAGIVLFSGSLYGLAASGLRGLGPVTPIGGLALIGGWVVLAFAAFRG